MTREVVVEEAAAVARRRMEMVMTKLMLPYAPRVAKSQETWAQCSHDVNPWLAKFLSSIPNQWSIPETPPTYIE